MMIFCKMRMSHVTKNFRRIQKINTLLSIIYPLRLTDLGLLPIYLWNDINFIRKRKKHSQNPEMIILDQMPFANTGLWERGSLDVLDKNTLYYLIDLSPESFFGLLCHKLGWLLWETYRFSLDTLVSSLPKQIFVCTFVSDQAQPL